MKLASMAAIVLLAAHLPARAQTPWDLGKKAVGDATAGKVEQEVNKRLLAESRKNQCSFKSDSDELQKGCRRPQLQVRGLRPHRHVRQRGAQQGALGPTRGAHEA